MHHPTKKGPSTSLVLTPRTVQLTVRPTSSACWKAAGALALIGALLWALEQ